MAPVNLKGVFLPALMYALLRSRTTPVVETPAEDEYDYIVVGSGWGGSVIASRLSEDPGIRVLLLEAGAKDNVSSEIPLLTLALHTEEYDWKYKTTPQEKACWGSKDKRCLLPSGKVEGGSSILDIMVYGRGQADELDELGERLNSPGWTSKEFGKYYAKHQDYHKDESKSECNPPADFYHGCGGPVHISSIVPSAKGDTTDMFVETAKELFGLEEHEFILDEIGVRQNVFLMKKGARVSASTAYLKGPSKTRKNLHISLNSFVRKIIIDPSSKRATGVEFEKKGVVKQVKAKKEVIVSAGVHGSPKLLMLSGIGAKEELDKHKIPVIVDVPGVGKNYKDLVSTFIILTTGKKMPEDKLQLVDTATIRDWAKGIGKMTTPEGLDASLTFRTSKASTKYPKKPDFLIIYQSLELYQIFAPFLQKSIGFSDEVWAKVFDPLIDMEIATLQPTIADIRSTGTVTLQSANPKDAPIAEPNFLSDKFDLERLIEAYQLTLKFADSKQYKDKGYKVSPYTFDACKDISDRASEEYIRCHLQYGMLTRYCGIGTCSMGPESDKMAVVDDRLRVRGVSGLRVIDASILSSHMGAPIAGTVIAIAEKGADMIKEDNK